MRDDQRQRYSRHLLLPGIDEAAYELVGQARVLVIGAGGLGSSALYYLAAAGVGVLGIADDDDVELSNLQRQILHGTSDIGAPKASSAAEKLSRLNPDVGIVCHHVRVGTDNVETLLADYDIVVTAVDDVPTRFAVNDECVRTGKTLVESAVRNFSGQAITIKGGESACYRCLFPVQSIGDSAIPDSDKGVFAPVVGVMGALQAAEVLKVITGVGEPLYNRILSVDLLDMTSTATPIERDPDCPVCGQRLR